VGGGIDYRSISHRNQDAVAIVLVEYTNGERSAARVRVDSLGTMVTNKHILTGDDGTKTPQRLVWCSPAAPSSGAAI